jgi:hypothetical protein
MDDCRCFHGGVSVLGAGYLGLPAWKMLSLGAYGIDYNISLNTYGTARLLGGTTWESPTSCQKLV